MKLSLAESLTVIAFFTLTIGGLTFQPGASWIATSFNFVVIVACAVSALVAVGAHRAFAFGFLVPVALYWSIVLTIGDNEFSIRSGELPTSQLFQAMLKPHYDSQGLSGAEITQRRMRAASLMPCGHSAVSVALGYLAGKYGRYIYTKTRRESLPA